MIVVEGPDAAGKSTLADHLAKFFHLPIQKSEGPPTYPGEINDRLERYSKLPPCIFDRHPVVSQYIYSKAFNRPIDMDEHWTHQFYAQHPILIYCDPLDQVYDHVVKAHDNEEHLKQIHNRYDALLDHYRYWAIEHATIIYRIGESKDLIARLVNQFNPTLDIQQFHERFGLDYDGKPRELPDDLRKFRIQFLAEELCEYVGLKGTPKDLVASVLRDHDFKPQLEDQLDALVDLVYVALGTAYLHGFTFDEAWRLVHTANMRKVRVTRAIDSSRNSVYDVCKPDGWKAPDLSHLVR
jgi:predicted HAD superfamily Cof-like phosphohydrolase